MSSRITYENKENLQDDENVARKNKVTDSDLNEIKEVVNAHADDIENFENYDDTEIKQKYNELQQENIELKKIQDDMIEKSLNKETEADTSLIVKDTDEFYGKLSVYGGQRQEKREGYNKFNAYDVAFVNGINTNQEIIKSENNIVIPFLATWSRRKCTINNLKHNTTYKIFCTKNGDEGIESGLWDGSNYTSTGFSTNSSAKLYIDVPTDENGTLTFFFYCNYSATNYGNKTVEFDEIMLYEGTEDKPYEPFGVMPSLAYPSEIEAVENSVEITTSNKNIFKETFNDKSQTNQYKSIVSGDFTLKANETYTVSFDTNNNGGRVYLNELLFNTSVRKNCNGDRQSIIATAKKSEVFKNEVVIKTGANATTNYNISNVQIELADTNSDCIEHEGETLIMPIQQAMYEEDGFEKKSDGWYEKHNWGIRVFDGTEEFGMDTTNKSFYVREDRAKRLTNYKDEILCNCYSSIETFEKGVSGVSGYHRSETYPGQNWIYFTDENYENVASFKAMLAQKYAEGNPLYVIYTLAETEYIKCTAEQSAILDKIDTYRNGTIITTDNDLCKISLRYKQDLESRISELEKQIVGGN